MAFERPTLKELVTRIREDFRTRMELLPLASAVLRRAVVHVVATVWAGATHMLHGHLEWTSKQLFVVDADRDSLVRQAAPYQLFPKPATFATGTIEATGTNGTDIPAETAFRRNDGAEFLTTADATISGGAANLSVQAKKAGAAGNTDAGAILTIETPIAGLDADATVDSSGLTGGGDAETTEEFRTRLIQRLREPPEGGAEHDYIAWAEEVPGVTRVWVYPNENGLGTVYVRFVRDDDGTGSAILPSAGEITAVQAKLDEERPITAEVTALAPTALTTPFTLSITPDNSSTREAVENALAELFQGDAEAGDGEGRGTIFLSRMQVAIGATTGVTDFSLASPSADVVPSLGQLPILGTVTFT